MLVEQRLQFLQIEEDDYISLTDMIKNININFNTTAYETIMWKMRLHIL